MIHYRINTYEPLNGFVHIQMRFKAESNSPIYLQLPAWRPGRYELANYARNIKNFSIHNEKGEPIPYDKITKEKWALQSSVNSEITVSYGYYAQLPDAGNSFVNAHFCYINPVNCLLYVEGMQHLSCEIELPMSASAQVACQLPFDGNSLHAENFDQLADSPFFIGADLQHHTVEHGTCTFHFWAAGEVAMNWEQLKLDTIAYANIQEEIFGALPMTDFHFLYLFREDVFRHGVEHANSTVIAMGPGKSMIEPLAYNDLLAISSHELFHVWNIKRMRPLEMLPYDFTKENYSKLGYVYEGITTYYGDLALVHAGVWNQEIYLKSLSDDLKKHVNNEGRFNYSLEDASFDTWVDGYVPGVPGRKVSIYTEGLVAALIADLYLLKVSKGKNRLKHVLTDMYQLTYLQQKGYTKNLYKELLEKWSGQNMDWYFQDMIEGKGKMTTHLEAAIAWIGCELCLTENEQGQLNCELKIKENQSDAENLLYKNWLNLTA